MVAIAADRTMSDVGGLRNRKGWAMGHQKVKNPRQSGSLTDIAVETIRDNILNLTLPPDSLIDEKLLMERFALSRTPVREALNRLAAEGLVEIRANRGILVQSMNLTEVMRFLDAYIASEKLIGFFCLFADQQFVSDMEEIQQRHTEAVENKRFLDIVKANNEFHLRIAAATENPYIESFSKRMHMSSRRLVYFVYRMESEEAAYHLKQQRSIVNEHRQILDQIRAADQDGLVKALSSHAKRFQRRIARFIESGRGADFPVS
jgi:DNA-binding GntR family transcriptional regulator